MISPPSTSLQVAVGIVFNGDGHILLTQRPPGKIMAGYWEFPGGKIESQETGLEALTRELKEELDITVTQATPFKIFHHEYPHGLVALQTFLVTAFDGVPKSVENQDFSWVALEDMHTRHLLPANGEIITALQH